MKILLLIPLIFPSIAWTCSDATLLEYTDRGSVTNTPCTLPPTKALIELGYQYQTLLPVATRSNLPQANLFIGLPSNNEFLLALPNYNRVSIAGSSGSSAALFGIKHELTTPDRWGVSTELLLTPPSGSGDFGSAGLGAALNGIISYSVHPKIDVVFMFGENTITESNQIGGQRFYTFNTSLSGVYKPLEKMSIFAEFFTEERTNFERAGNYNIDGGVLYMWRPNIVFDVEAGQQLSHQYDHFNRFISGGVSVLFAV